MVDIAKKFHSRFGDSVYFLGELLRKSEFGFYSDSSREKWLALLGKFDLDLAGHFYHGGGWKCQCQCLALTDQSRF